MSDGFPYADIVILALIAGFVLLRLRSVLGQKIDHDTRPLAAYRATEAESPVVQVDKPKNANTELQDPDEKLLATLADTSLRETLLAIKAADKSFSLSRFVEGAKAAFEMVFDAFVKDDRDTLKMLLSPELFATFAAELDKRKTMGNYPETTLLALISQEITGATLAKNIAHITLKHISEQVSVVRDKSGKITEGDPSASHHVEDHWVFERDLTSRNPNWKIIET